MRCPPWLQVIQPGSPAPFFSASISPRLPSLSLPLDTAAVVPRSLLTLVQHQLDPATNAPLPGKFWGLVWDALGRVSLTHLDALELQPSGAKEFQLSEAELARLSPLGLHIQCEGLDFPAPEPLGPSLLPVKGP
jgi:hypothetical protein